MVFSRGAWVLAVRGIGLETWLSGFGFSGLERLEGFSGFGFSAFGCRTPFCSFFFCRLLSGFFRSARAQGEGKGFRALSLDLGSDAVPCKRRMFGVLTVWCRDSVEILSEVCWYIYPDSSPGSSLGGARVDMTSPKWGQAWSFPEGWRLGDGVWEILRRIAALPLSRFPSETTRLTVSSQRLNSEPAMPRQGSSA